MNRQCCPLCGSTDYMQLYRSKKSPGPLVKCASCDFLFICPIEDTKALIEDGPVLSGQPIDLLNSSDLSHLTQWEKSLISNYMSEEYAKRKNAQSALQRISCTISPPGRLLDIGCFCGVFLDVAGQAGWTCQGVEPLLGPSIYARSHYGLNVVTNTLSEDTFEQGSFDVITSFQVFEHLVDPVRELRIINSLLKPGGIVVIEVPNLSVFAAKLFRGYHRHFVKDHLNFFNRRTLEKALEDSGFLPVDLWYPSRLMTAEHLLGWLRRLTGNAGSASHDENLSREPRASGFIKLNFRDIIAVVARKNIDA